eukprot:3941046-Rhodomonas_salina.5
MGEVRTRDWAWIASSIRELSTGDCIGGYGRGWERVSSTGDCVGWPQQHALAWASFLGEGYLAEHSRGGPCIPCDAREQLSPVDEVHDEAEAVGGLESKVQLDDERMVYNFEHAPLGLGGLDEPPLVDGRLAVNGALQALVLRQLELEVNVRGPAL